MTFVLLLALAPQSPIQTEKVLPAVTFADSKKTYVLARDVAKARGWTLTFDRLTKLSTLNGESIPVDQPTLFDGTLLLESARFWPKVQVGTKKVEVDLAKQVLTAWQGDVRTMRVHVNSGDKRSDTPAGSYLTGGKKADKVSSIYGSEMPFAVHLKGNYFIHGSDFTLGGPGSHGCIRLPMYNHAAEWFYKWVDRGTPVKVFGKRTDPH